MAAAAPARSEALAPPPGNPRFALFDGLRALAALAVLVYHAGYYSRANEGGGGLSPYLSHLNVGVAVFFAISGFLLYRPLLAGRIGVGPPIGVRDYARRRVLRIVPAYWVALSVLALYPGLPGLFGHRWWVYYAFGQDYSAGTVVSGIGPAWSLGCEVVFYAVLPLYSLALDRVTRAAGRRLWWQFEVLVLALLAASSFVWRAHVLHHPSLPSATAASTLVWFVLGMVLALASVAWAQRPEGRLKALARSARWGWLLAAVAYVVLCRGLGLGGGFVFFERLTVAQDLGVYALSGVVALGLLLPAVFPASGPSLTRRFLAARPMAWLGLVSYGIYLYHQPIADALGGGIRSGGDSAIRFLWLAPATAAIAISAAAVSYYVVERPALRFKERRRRRPRPVLETAA